jgi:hypothetical protein
MDQMDSRLRAAWLSQLTREYNDICYQYRVRLQPPVLMISRSRKQLGSWSAGDRTLSLSHFLISAHPWNLTLQVLKHEMAHQMVSEIHGRDDVGHGPLFREACARLGLDAPFHRASADLEEGLADAGQGTAATEQGRQVIDKVRKLLALGGSDNEHEAALAVQRAGELLTRYRLDFDALAEDEGLTHRTINTGGRTLPAHRKAICSLLESCFAVRVICASTYDPLTDQVFKTIELLGREEETAIAEHCHHFLENRLQILWERNRRGFAGNSRIAKKSYYLGVLAGFRETLERSRPKVAPTAPAPAPRQTADLPAHRALQAQQRLEAFVAFRFPRLRQMRGKATAMHGEAYRQAMAEGRELTLHRPMDGSGAPTRLLS